MDHPSRSLGWRRTTTLAVVFTFFLIVPSAFAQVRIATPDYGEATGGFPNWQERAVAELSNRARSAPATDLAGCSSCAEAACYSPVAPLVWKYELNESARFQSASMGMFPFFAHDTPCVLFTDIASRYPGTSNGSFASSCSTSGTTPAGTRITYFAGNWSGENIAAGFGGPWDAFYTWLYESSSNSACGFHSNLDNGHRYNILTNGPALGVGYQYVGGSPYGSYWTQDFGGGPSVPRIPSGSHWTSTNHGRDPQGSDTTVQFWANWYDTSGPNAATVVLDGAPHTMTLARGSATNGAYTFSATGMSTACHSYYFAFTTSSMASVRYPDTGTFGFGNSACLDWQNAAAPAAVTSVVAGATTSTNVQVSWSGSCVSTCRIYRSADHINYSQIGSQSASPFNDTAAATGTAYLYKVRAYDGTTESADSNSDLATTVIYTDGSLSGLPIGALHLTQLRSAVNAVRTLAGVGTASFTDPSPAGVPVKAIHITELRTDLDQAMSVLGATTGGYTDPSLTGTVVRAVHFQELRDRMK